jgi:hypothetical protein
MMKNAIPYNGLWTTPDNLEQLVEMLNNCGDKNEQRMAWHGAMLALNLAHMMQEKEMINA